MTKETKKELRKAQKPQSNVDIGEHKNLQKILRGADAFVKTFVLPFGA